MRVNTFASLFVCVAIISVVFHADVLAHDRTKPVIAGSLKIEKIWARATTASSTNGVAYVMITNSGTADRLIGAETPIAASTQFHTTVDDAGKTIMRPTASGIEVPSGGRAVLRPGVGHSHIMLVALRDPIRVGTPFPATLIFERAGRVDVTFRVVALGASPAHAGH